MTLLSSPAPPNTKPWESSAPSTASLTSPHRLGVVQVFCLALRQEEPRVRAPVPDRGVTCHIPSMCIQLKQLIMGIRKTAQRPQKVAHPITPRILKILLSSSPHHPLGLGDIHRCRDCFTIFFLKISSCKKSHFQSEKNQVKLKNRFCSQNFLWLIQCNGLQKTAMHYFCR